MSVTKFVDSVHSTAQPRRATLDNKTDGPNGQGVWLEHGISKDYIPGDEFQFTAALTAAGANVVKAAQAAKQIKVQSLQASNSGATQVILTISDNATILFQTNLPIGSSGISFYFSPPLIGTVNTVMNCAISGSTTSAQVNIQGFVE